MHRQSIPALIVGLGSLILWPLVGLLGVLFASFVIAMSNFVLPSSPDSGHVLGLVSGAIFGVFCGVGIGILNSRQLHGSHFRSKHWIVATMVGWTAGCVVVAEFLTLGVWTALGPLLGGVVRLLTLVLPICLCSVIAQHVCAWPLRLPAGRDVMMGLLGGVFSPVAVSIVALGYDRETNLTDMLVYLAGLMALWGFVDGIRMWMLSRYRVAPSE